MRKACGLHFEGFISAMSEYQQLKEVLFSKAFNLVLDVFLTYADSTDHELQSRVQLF